MYQEEELRAAMVRRRVTIKELAKAVNLSDTGFWNKLTGKRDFTVPEVTSICDFLRLDPYERECIFFASDVEKNDTEVEEI